MADSSFFFYDLETSGISPREGRIMQFAGQRTSLDLEPLGDPINLLIKLTPDILPEPDAIFITGITPQQTLADGITEAEFVKIFNKDIARAGTIFVGYNSVRFDDEFMRYTLYRNFCDAYEWQWRDDRSRWDLLDVVRMTRALRPDGIKWPFAPNGSPTNRLELLTSLNKLDHTNAHDALSDVNATIALANLIKSKQPDLFKYLLDMRDKKKVAGLVESGQPFVYSSGKYSNEHEKTTVVVHLAKHPKKQASLVYDLRHDPSEFAALSVNELAERMKWTHDDNAPARLPVKALQYNKCPAVAPLGVLDKSSQKRLELDIKSIEANRQKLTTDFIKKVLAATEQLDSAYQNEMFASDQLVDAQLYDGFIGDADKRIMNELRQSSPDRLSNFQFNDKRLNALLPLYKARNYPASLSDEERSSWDNYRQSRLIGGGTSSRMAKFGQRLATLASDPKLDKNKAFLLEELQLYAESIMPLEMSDQDALES